MIEEILPRKVVCVDRRDDAVESDLFPEEEALIERAVPKRRREFTTTRHCARRALDRLGVAPAPITRDGRGAPAWPAGTVGSMTHCDGFRAAAVALRADVLALGIDAEPNAELPEGVAEAVTVGGEGALLERLSGRRDQWGAEVHWGRVLFSAKESVYKVWYPIMRRWLDFSEAELDIDPVRGTFAARLLVPGPVLDGYGEVGEFTGRWTVRDGLIATAIALPAK